MPKKPRIPIYELTFTVNSAAQCAEYEARFHDMLPFLKFGKHTHIKVKIEADDGDYPKGTLCFLFDHFDDLSISPNDDFNLIGRDGGAWLVKYKDRTYLMEKLP